MGLNNDIQKQLTKGAIQEVFFRYKNFIAFHLSKQLCAIDSPERFPSRTHPICVTLGCSITIISPLLMSSFLRFLHILQITDLSNDVLVQLLLYGDQDLSYDLNRKILELTLRYIHETGRFD